MSKVERLVRLSDQMPGNQKLQDRTITCVDCKTEFEWTAGEQKYYAERNLSSPKRCEPCRRVKRDRSPRTKE